MRYRSNTTVLCGYLTPNSNVKIKMISTVDDRIISTTDDICIESKVADGLYFFDTSKINETFEKLEIAYIMEDDAGEVYGGKIVIIDELVPMIEDIGLSVNSSNSKIDNISPIIDEINDKDTFNISDNDKIFITDTIQSSNQDLEQIIKDIQLGNWEIKNNQMIMLSQSGVEIARFNLFDLQNKLTMRSVMKRTLV